MWHAKAKSANGDRVHLRIDESGQVYPDEQVSKLSEQDVRASLESQGYTDVHDVDFDNGIWKAKAAQPGWQRRQAESRCAQRQGNRYRLAADGKPLGRHRSFSVSATRQLPPNGDGWTERWQLTRSGRFALFPHR